MDLSGFREIAARCMRLRIAVAGDFCLDRYLEIDPARAETSIETGLPVRNVVRVRPQPGAAGTVLNNLASLGVGELYPVGFCGDDGEGYELRCALAKLPGARLDAFVTTPERRTFTYCKPLLIEPGKAPRELERLDSKNWTPTPAPLQRQLINHIGRLAPEIDALILMDQVDVTETGVVTSAVRDAALDALRKRPSLLVLADSRRGLGDYPPLAFKMNAAELAALSGAHAPADVSAATEMATHLARRNRQPVFVTLSEHGIVAASPDGAAEHAPALAVRGPIDIVGAGDSVTANLAAALAAGASMRHAIEIAMAAASVVVHKLGTTGTASPQEIEALLET
ncbi:MAG TPA: PfkB family carbohydrate kinase [Verrucomicrobiae bacterium]|nr:PfkB family carbohydrate kinase [Verrucomicrobiae bacterium]